MSASAPVREATVDEIDRFWRDGVVVIRDFYPQSLIDLVAAALDEICDIGSSETGDPREPFFRADAYLWHTNDRIRDFCLHGPTASLVAGLLRSERLRLFGDQIFVKQALNAERTPWHHDLTFFPLAGDQIASAWTSVDPVIAYQSSLEFIVGSHRWPNRYRPMGVGGIVKSVALMEAAPDFYVERGSAEIASWDLRAGDVVVFHGLTVHGCRGASMGETHRRALSTRWCGDDVRFRPSETELQVGWRHGLHPGDSLGGPVFPQVWPSLKADEVSARLAGPVSADEELLAQNRDLAKRFDRIRL
jgi:ectoine hydroxylase-related dioxygenase (phytanoyl-CoA dioxygenase family)